VLAAAELGAGFDDEIALVVVQRDPERALEAAEAHLRGVGHRVEGTGTQLHFDRLRI
jgi:DNA-binding FadR family transcriptional regulator